MKQRHRIALLAGLCVALGTAATAGTLTGNAPIVIGHRGASGYLPEHTIESYRRAIQLGADYIEPDLVSTRDGVLIARHEPVLDNTTDVASRAEFAARRTTKTLDGVPTTGWFAEDFTLAEIKTLRAVQPNGARDQSFNGLYQIPTFQEVIDLVNEVRTQTGKTIGLYPETKHPTFFKDQGLALEPKLVAALTANGLTGADAKVFIQSFEVSNLQQLRTLLPNAKLVQLIDANDVNADGSIDLTAPYGQPYDFTVAGDPRTYKDLLTPAGLDFINDYADGIGPWKPYIISWRFIDADNNGVFDDLNGDGVIDQRDRVLLPASDVVDDAHAAGLLVHPYTFRNEPTTLASNFGGDPKAELLAYIATGIDGFFTDFPDTGRAAVDASVPVPASALLLAGMLVPLARLRRRTRAAAVAGTALAALATGAPALAQQEFPAVLAGHAVMPAATFIAAPADAPADLKISGKYTTGKRVDAIGSVMGKSFERPTGIALPFDGQPVQGHSGVKVMPDGSYWILTDNGFGSKANSPDAMLFLNRYRIDWEAGRFERLETLFLHDPERKVPFRIVHEGTDKRYLTGSDLDLEGFQWIGDTLWIGEEFGPYIIKADRQGRVLAVHETVADGKPVRSPDHSAVASPAVPSATGNFNLRRSKGYEGFAASKDGRFIYGLLEGPLWNADAKDWERVGGKEAARILEFDVAAERFTGRFWHYPFELAGNAIGDINMIDATTALVIERDNGEGTAARACPAGQRGESCFPDLAKFKRVYKIEFGDMNAGKPVRKIAFIDLMKIEDPQRKTRKPLDGDALTFPFFTIENVDVVDARHIVIGNDNNLPFSSSRDPNKADDNEFVLLQVEAFLKAR